MLYGCDHSVLQGRRNVESEEKGHRAPEITEKTCPGKEGGLTPPEERKGGQSVRRFHSVRTRQPVKYGRKKQSWQFLVPSCLTGYQAFLHFFFPFRFSLKKGSSSLIRLISL